MDPTPPGADRPCWTPSAARVAAANMTRFIAHVREAGAPVSDYASLWRWSCHQPEAFWPAVWDFCGLVAERRGDAVVEDLDRMPGARWFPGARINFAENLLRRRDDRPALIWRDETGARAAISFPDLRARVSGLARSLRDAGVRPGDRVAGYLANVPEAVVAMLATASVGGVWSSCSPDYGLEGVLDRFAQIRPRVLVAADASIYAGKRHDLMPRVRGIASRLEAIERVIVAPRLDARPDLSGLPGAAVWDDVAAPSADPIPFERLPFDHPLYILYSSGTTGRPKCIVHGAGGTLIQHLKEHVLHTDLRRDDVFFYFTTCGWMMWNWLVSGLATGTTIQLYDGSPVHPDPAALWRVAAEEGTAVFGTSAGYLAAIEKAGVRPRRDHDLSRLRTILSTGSPLAPASYDYVYRDIGDDIQLSSISGGTDIISCFALGNPIAPVRRGEIQTRGLGMKVAILDPQGREMTRGKGELCCTLPFPSMPVSFWDDPEGARYRASYFERFPGVWAHGDFAEITPHDGVIIHGRSDATLNPGGVRIGTAEIYRVVERIPEVLEAVAVGQEWRGDTRVILFVAMKPGHALDDALRATIRERLKREASPRHVPARILPIPAVPRTLSGKVSEIAVRETIHGRPAGNRDALANPEALDALRDLPDLREE